MRSEEECREGHDKSRQTLHGDEVQDKKEWMNGLDEAQKAGCLSCSFALSRARPRILSRQSCFNYSFPSQLTTLKSRALCTAHENEMGEEEEEKGMRPTELRRTTVDDRGGWSPLKQLRLTPLLKPDSLLMIIAPLFTTENKLSWSKLGRPINYSTAQQHQHHLRQTHLVTTSQR